MGDLGQAVNMLFVMMAIVFLILILLIVIIKLMGIILGAFHNRGKGSSGSSGGAGADQGGQKNQPNLIAPVPAVGKRYSGGGYCRHCRGCFRYGRQRRHPVGHPQRVPRQRPEKRLEHGGAAEKHQSVFFINRGASGKTASAVKMRTLRRRRALYV